MKNRMEKGQEDFECCGLFIYYCKLLARHIYDIFVSEKALKGEDIGELREEETKEEED